MSRLTRSVCLLLVVSGCATGQAARPPSETVAKGALITTEEVRGTQAKDAYEIIQFLRPSWLQRRGAYTFGDDGGVAVYLNAMRLPGLEALREIESSAVTSIRYFDSMGAQFRFGLSHNHGAIQVVTERSK
ncbi:MAG: hypothetical protein ABR499_13260 [Gemmatimonadaceae bacterium]